MCLSLFGLLRAETEKGGGEDEELMMIDMKTEEIFALVTVLIHVTTLRSEEAFDSCA